MLQRAKCINYKKWNCREGNQGARRAYLTIAIVRHACVKLIFASLVNVFVESVVVLSSGSQEERMKIDEALDHLQMVVSQHQCPDCKEALETLCAALTKPPRYEIEFPSEGYHPEYRKGFEAGVDAMAMEYDLMPPKNDDDNSEKR
jgi:N-acetylglutamate synthase/N-acetylornithine aminotransferase